MVWSPQQEKGLRVEESAALGGDRFCASQDVAVLEG